MKSFCFLFLLLFPSFAFPQGLQIFQGGVDVTGKTVITAIEPNHMDNGYYSYFTIYNSSDKPISFYVKRVLNRPIPSDYILYFAIDLNMYVPSTDIEQTIPDTITLKAGASLPVDNRDGLNTTLFTSALCIDFSADYVLVNANGQDTVKVTIQYSCTNSIEEEEAGIFSAPYPVPAQSFATIDYTFHQPSKKASLFLYNTLGKSAAEIALDNANGKVKIDLNAFPAGLYFYSFIKDAQVVHTGKLLITDH